MCIWSNKSISNLCQLNNCSMLCSLNRLLWKSSGPANFQQQLCFEPHLHLLWVSVVVHDNRYKSKWRFCIRRKLHKYYIIRLLQLNCWQKFIWCLFWYLKSTCERIEFFELDSESSSKCNRHRASHSLHLLQWQLL